jgi:ribosomal protein L11 methyltransferase
LQAAQPAGKTVLDVGTGSGVLSLAAAKLGASEVIGIDNDPDAVENARENMSINGLRVDFRCVALGAVAEPLRAFADVLLANLTGPTLLRYTGELKAMCRDGGIAILSGLREEEEDGVARAFGGATLRRSSEDGWVCLMVRTQR